MGSKLVGLFVIWIGIGIAALGAGLLQAILSPVFLSPSQTVGGFIFICMLIVAVPAFLIGVGIYIFMDS